MKRLSVLALVTALAATTIAVRSIHAQTPVPIISSERWSIKSVETGVEYRIDVALPAGYDSTNTRYPTFYILDANLSFSMLTDVYRMLHLGGLVPDLILVGVGYQEPDARVFTPAYSANRDRDYTPTTTADAPVSGHAREFLKFLATELFPMVDGRYRTDPSDRGLGGHSLGGLFTTYAVYHRPDLFRRYWLGSPSLWWDEGVAFTWKGAGQATGRAFLTVGDQESDVMVPPMRRMAAVLPKAFPGLEVSSMVFPSENHMSVPPGSVSRALRFLYGRSAVTLTAAQQADYVGRWRGAKSGEVIEIAIRRGRLSATMPLQGHVITLELQAETPDRLFAGMTGGTFAFERDGRGKPIRLKRTGYGEEIEFVRVP